MNAITRPPSYRRRWSDHDLNVGPFTFAAPSRGYRPTTIMLCSGDDEGSSASLRISVVGWTALLMLPRWLVPTERTKLIASTWTPADVARMGRNWYWDEKPRKYGVSVSEGHLSVHFGRQTHDSSTEQSWGCFLPWTQWRHVRHSLYGLDGEHFADMPRRKKGLRLGDPGFNDHWEAGQELEARCPTRTFAFKDFDGEELTASTRIEEREWLRGEKWCAWLSWFTAPKIRRSLDLRFSDETGRRKGSWKGGTLGTGIDMASPAELHQAAFERYCAKHEMTYLGEVIHG